MRISFFGSLADAIGRQVELPVPEGASVGEVRRRLATAYPAAAANLDRPQVLAAIDDRIADDGEAVPEGADLAFFPPLSGG